jgi:hypothetical protein
MTFNPHGKKATRKSVDEEPFYFCNLLYLRNLNQQSQFRSSLGTESARAGLSFCAGELPDWLTFRARDNIAST